MSDGVSSDADARIRPVDLRLDRRDGLFIEWADGAKSQYPLVLLRKNCPCATCRTEREAAPPAAQPSASGLSLTILPANIDRAAQFTGASMVGNYAIQITWADGHRTGIYDFRHLRGLTSITPPP